MEGDDTEHAKTDLIFLLLLFLFPIYFSIIYVSCYLLFFYLLCLILAFGELVLYRGQCRILV